MNEMEPGPPPTEKRLAAARSAIEERLRTESKLSEWRNLFMTNPHALSPLAPLGVEGAVVEPALDAREGAPAVVLYGHRGEGTVRFAAIELEDRESPAGCRVLLVEDVDAAVTYCESARAFGGPSPRHASRQILCVGNREYLFILFDLAEDACDRLESELLKEGALPAELRLLSYGETRALFARKVPPLVMFVSPAVPSLRQDGDITDILARLRDRDFTESAMCG